MNKTLKCFLLGIVISVAGMGVYHYFSVHTYKAELVQCQKNVQDVEKMVERQTKLRCWEKVNQD